MIILHSESTTDQLILRTPSAFPQTVVLDFRAMERSVNNHRRLLRSVFPYDKPSIVQKKPQRTLGSNESAV